MNRLLLAALLALLLGWLLTNYRPLDRANTLLVSGPFEFTSQDLAKDGYLYTRMQVAETLVAVDAQGQAVPMLATDWQVNDNQWRFTLRQGVRFHNGQPLTAKQVKHSLDIALTKPGPLQQVPIEAIETDEQDLLVTLTAPYRPLPAVLAHYSTAILSADSYDADGQVIQLYATGPYQTARLAPPHKLETRRFEEYWGQAAAIEFVHYLTGHRAESRALQARTGDADLVYTLDPASLEQLGRSKGLSVHSESLPRTLLLKLNSAHRFLDHPDSRRAISLALDRTGIAEQVIRVPGSEANQLFPPSLSGWHQPDWPALEQDLDTARTLLAKQGWQMGPTGLLKRGSDRFELRLVTYADRPELTVLATAIQAQLRELGISVLISVDNASAIPSGHHDGSLEMALVARNYALVPDPLVVLQEDSASPMGSDWGPMGWHSPAMAHGLSRMAQSEDTSEYWALAEQVSELLMEELPLIPVAFYTQQISVNDRVKGFQFDPFELNYRLSEMRFKSD
ncbi:ABC transporter substrate-binding protein [Ferrimonas marina]|uniref:Peptide/nickel transport system substrate-binding protein n=1 Tax=Ferrimonas marina TaxID=299255 RepID=A0A1M5Z9D8_9GAMM|nr:ABC transporter substrate-binding protein [Ferrimonas marina]SHI20866.1 peptide/nickel transport system substrate-binding protein [Ferrimonas marina]